MKIVCIGGGPAGLYFGISMKLRNPAHDVRVVERNRPYDTFGWGVVLSDETLTNLWRNDPESTEKIVNNFAHWDDIDVHFKGRLITSSGHGFSGLGRKRLLNILQNRAHQLGIDLEFEQNVTDPEQYRYADLVVGSDGINSDVREAYQKAFQPTIDYRPNKFVWLGTHRIFEAFTFIFEKVKEGWIWAHAYRFDQNTSTFIVECSEETWTALGFNRLSAEEGVHLCERIFAEYLDGHRLINNATHLDNPWINFPVVSCQRWHHENVVLMGDAAHSAHFSVGSGTKLALEDAIDLANMLKGNMPTESILREYRETRNYEVLKLQNAARNSTQWFETVPRYAQFKPLQFAYSLLTRSQRVSHENLRLRDRKWLEGLESWFASAACGETESKPIPPMFTPYRLRDLQLKNRVIVSPMAMYSAKDGTPDDFHLVHWGSRAQGGAALLFTEMTCVTPNGRITPGCCGMYKKEHADSFRRVVDFVHQHTDTNIGLQLGHSGPKGSTKLGWEGMDEPLEEGNWEVIGPSPIPWSEQNQVPREMTRQDMDEIRDAFVQATEMGEAAGFDILELHCAHGYLLSAFITPLENQRFDEYGGSLENRLRYPLEVFRAMRDVWPVDKPMSVRISATDWVEGGVTGEESIAIARAFYEAGADIIDVSAGQTSINAKPVYGRMFQTPFSDQIRNEAKVPTMTVGNIYEIDHVNSIIAAGRADLCCLARPHLWDPYWTLRAAAQQGVGTASWPKQYQAAQQQLERLFERAAAQAPTETSWQQEYLTRADALERLLRSSEDVA